MKEDQQSVSPVLIRISHWNVIVIGVNGFLFRYSSDGESEQLQTQEIFTSVHLFGTLSTLFNGDSR